MVLIWRRHEMVSWIILAYDDSEGGVTLSFTNAKWFQTPHYSSLAVYSVTFKSSVDQLDDRAFISTFSNWFFGSYRLNLLSQRWFWWFLFFNVKGWNKHNKTGDTSKWGPFLFYANLSPMIGPSLISLVQANTAGPYGGRCTLDMVRLFEAGLVEHQFAC